MFIQDKCLLFFLLGRDKKLLLIDLSIEREFWPLIDFNGPIMCILVAIVAEGREGICESERLTLGLL